jgi:hypothetical protein
MLRRGIDERSAFQRVDRLSYKERAEQAARLVHRPLPLAASSPEPPAPSSRPVVQGAHRLAMTAAPWACTGAVPLRTRAALRGLTYTHWETKTSRCTVTMPCGRRTHDDDP